MSITQNGVLQKDDNGYPVMGGTSSVDDNTIINASFDPITRRLLTDSAAGSGTVSSIASGTGILLTPDPITTTGSVALVARLQPAATLTGNSLKVLRVNAGETAVEYATPTAGTVTSVSGTENRITSTGGATPVIDISASYVGQASITTLGTITTGVWTGTTIAIANGGTGATSKAAAFDALSPMTTGGDIIYGGTSGTGTRLANGSVGQVLTSGGTTVAPTWATPTTGTVTTVSVATENGFSGTVANATTTPAITIIAGAITPTTVNGLTISTTTGTLTMTNSKTLAVTNSLTLSGTDSTVMTFPTTTATIARTDAAQTFTGVQTTTQVLSTNNAITASGNAATVPVTSKINTVTNNSAATLTVTLTTSGAIDRQPVIVCILDSSAAAQTITWVNTENSTVTAPVTSNGSTTLPVTVGFMYNNATSKWRCVASA